MTSLKVDIISLHPIMLSGIVEIVVVMIGSTDVVPCFYNGK